MKRISNNLLPIVLALVLSGLLVRAALAWLDAPDTQDPNQNQAVSPISLELIQAGHDWHYRRGCWFPVTVEVRNDGPDTSGTLEWLFPGQPTRSFRREVDLPRGAHKRLTLYAYTPTNTRIGEMRLLLQGDTPKEEHRREVQIEPVEPNWFIVGVLSNNATLLNSLSDMSVGKTTKTVVLHLDPDLLPTQAAAMSRIDALFLHDTALDRLRPEQRTALEQWVWLGGQLVVGGGSHANQTTAGIADLLPVAVHQLERNVSLAPLQEMLPQTIAREDETSEDETSETMITQTLPNATTVNHVELKTGAVALDTKNLITGQTRGNGRVFFARFDLGILRSWLGEARMWEHILKDNPQLVPPETLNLRSVLEIPGLSLPSVGLLILFMGGYIVVIGPLNFLLLRKYQRVDLAWLTTPAIVILFIIGTYGAGVLGRGINPKVFHLAIVQGEEGREVGQEISYIGIFSPYRNSYTLTFPGETLVAPENPFNYNFSDASLRKARLVWTETTSEIRDVLIDVGSLHPFVLEHPVALPLRVRSSLHWQKPQQEGTGQRNQQNTPQEAWQIAGEIANEGSEPLYDVIVTHGAMFQQIGTIPSGKSRSVTLTPEGDSFSSIIWGQLSDDTFDRQRIVSQLFNGQPGYTSSRPTPSGPFPQIQLDPIHMLSRDTAYLLAWSEQPLTTPLINGKHLKQNNLVLYVIRLGEVGESRQGERPPSAYIPSP